MNNLKTILMFAAFAVMLGAAIFAYNSLSGLFAQRESAASAEAKIEEAAETKAETEAKAEPEDTPSDKHSDAEDNTEEAPAEKERVKAPDFTVLDTEGNEVKLSDMLGTPVVLNFWASWCPPCKSEMPEFEAVYNELGGEVAFMMVNQTDGMRETKEVGANYISEQGYTFPVYFDMGLELSKAYGIFSIPTTIFIDKDGYAVSGIQGAINEETLRSAVDGLLE